MIIDKGRADWFGASDTSFIVGNYETATFKKWWLEKIGWKTNDFSNIAMTTGTHFEHKILDTIDGVRKDHQIIIPKLCLRVNYDGDKDKVIYEVKTHNIEKPFKITKSYWRQAQVEMYAMDTKEVYIVSYGLTENDYKNYFTPIDKDRIVFTKVEYDEEFINNEYLPKLKYLCECLEKGVMPK